MLKNSPAPWKIEFREGGKPLGISYVDEDDGEEILFCEFPYWDDEYIDELRANALLMCASTELFSALDRLVAVAALELGDNYEAIVVARAALKLASEGGSE